MICRARTCLVLLLAAVGAAADLPASGSPHPHDELVVANGQQALGLSLAAIGRLHPSVQDRARGLLDAARERGIALVVTSGFRSIEEQDRSYEQGRSCPGRVVTHVRGGESWHNYGLAFDVAVLDGRGKPSWPEDAELWRRVGELGEGLGLIWGGRFPIKDRPHFEFRGGLSIRDAQRGGRPKLHQEPQA